jgi:hypothetical protein
LKPESKFWKEWKAFTPNILWTRIEKVKSLASSISKLYEGKNIKELAARGLQLDACCLGLDACRLHLESL